MLQVKLAGWEKGDMVILSWKDAQSTQLSDAFTITSFAALRITDPAVHPLCWVAFGWLHLVARSCSEFCNALTQM